jgi:hypothetical protein
VQTIAYQASKSSSSDVVFRAAAGESVVFAGQVNVQASHLTIDGGEDADGYIMMRQGLEIESITPDSPKRTDITIRHVDAMGNQSSIASVENVLVYDAYFGGYHKSTGDSLGNDALRVLDSGRGVPTNITLDHIYVGEIGRGDSGPHNDCLEGSDGVNLTIRNSRFWHCATQGLYLSGGTSAQFDNVLVENNWFGPCSTPWQGFVGNKCSDIVIIEWDKPNLTFRYNSIGAPEGWRIGTNGPTTGPIVVKGNTGASPGCGRPVTVYESNVWQSGQPCSGTDVVASPAFVAAPAVGSTCTGYDSATKRVTPELCWRIENHSFDYNRRFS